MVHALGGSNSFLSSYEKQLAGNSYSEEIFLNESGWIKEIDTRKLGLTLTVSYTHLTLPTIYSV